MSDFNEGFLFELSPFILIDNTKMQLFGSGRRTLFIAKIILFIGLGKNDVLRLLGLRFAKL